MFGSLFKHPSWFSSRQSGFDATRLGHAAIALPAAPGCSVPPACAAVLVDRNGRSRRLASGARINPHDGEAAWVVHPGPYHLELLPFAAAPEVGLSVSIAIDASDPRASYQRFDLFLASEAGGAVEVGDLASSMQTALQRELAQGNLDLPPCTTLDEWNVFRAGFNQLMFTRFGVMVDDCVPVDLGATRDYPRLLEARLAELASSAPQAAPPAPSAAAQEAFVPACEDARALRRLFLELPCLMCAIRMAALPEGQAQFRQQQNLLRRLDLVSLSVGSMPALELSAPNVALGESEQWRRARHSRRAAAALDESWALLARFKNAGDAALAPLFDDADRIVANLETETAGRRLVAPIDVEEVQA